MRKRLLDAAIDCLRTEGYAGTTVSRIIERAKVSRGAPVHHFPSKAALIAAAARRLAQRIYLQLGRALLNIPASDDRLHDLIDLSWREAFNQPEHIALNELLRASQHDPELAEIMQELWTASYRTLVGAAEHYLEPLREGEDVGQYMVLTQWLLRGMAQDTHLVENPALYDHFLRTWTRMLSLHLKAKPGIMTPPPKPKIWEPPAQ
ncbi:Transcriptional regulator [gamma proteobacterium HdN1]|nr:Transcriptional regulator [gamma proteobacterium HdN1]